MTPRTTRDSLQDILESIGDAEEFIAGLAFEEFANDKKTTNATIRSIEVIGEAAKNIPQSVRDLSPGIPWKRMAGMRDKMIHAYFGVDVDILWTTLKEDIPPLKAQFETLLTKIPQ